MIPDIYTHYLDLDTSVPACVVKNDDGSFTIILNSRMSAERQRKSYEHEVKHILDGDFDSDEDVDIIEGRRHRG